MTQGLKIVTMRGETYVFSARPGTPPVDYRYRDPFVLIVRADAVLGVFPARNIEAVLPIVEIDGEVAP